MCAARPRTRVDLVMTLALVGTSQLEVWAPAVMPGVGETTSGRPVLAITAAAATVPLAARRRYPLAVLVTVVGALALQQAPTSPTEGLSLLAALMVAAYSSSAHASPARAGISGGVIVLGTALVGQNTGDWAFLAVVLGAAWLLGFVVAQSSTELAEARRDNADLSRRLTAPSPKPEDLATLTARELDVVRALARGSSNSEIAAELVISQWTVKTHVASILRKLRLRDRAQVVVAAYESGLVVPRPEYRNRTPGA